MLLWDSNYRKDIIAIDSFIMSPGITGYQRTGGRRLGLVDLIYDVDLMWVWVL